MSYRLMPDGSIECDSIDELNALRNQPIKPAPLVRPAAVDESAGKSARRGPKTRRRVQRRTTSLPPPNLSIAFHQMTDGAQKLLRVLKDRQRIDLAAIREAVPELGANEYALSGVLAAVQKRLKACGIDPKTVVQRDQRGYGANRIVTYTAGPALRDFQEAG